MHKLEENLQWDADKTKAQQVYQPSTKRKEHILQFNQNKAEYNSISSTMGHRHHFIHFHIVIVFITLR